MKLQETLRHGIFFLAAVFVLSLFMAGIVYSKDEVKLTPEFLASGKWVIPGVAFEGGPCSGSAKFTKDGHFTMFWGCVAEGPDIIDVSGTYKIKGNKITFDVKKNIKEKFPTLLKPGDSFEAVLKVLTDKEEYSLEYRWGLDVKIKDRGSYCIIFNNETGIKAGDTVKIKGIDAVSMGAVKGTVTAALKIREAPDAKAKEITFSKACVDGKEVEAKSVDKGTELIIYGRTKDMVKTGKWNNYWYYVKFYSNDCSDGVQIDYHVTGWVFGEFVKIK
jgi:hypothetical protein